MEKIAIFGCGVMGSAIIQALIKDEVFTTSRIFGVDVDGKKLGGLKRKFGIKTSKNAKEVIEKVDAIILGVKPQQLEKLCEGWKFEGLVISILAGVKMEKIKKLTKSKKVVRVMPNTPLQVGMGVSAWKASSKVTKKEKALVRKILESFGEQAEIHNEKLFDAITAISGSGPAYFFAFAEALEEAARKVGLGKLATPFVGETFFGSAKLADVSEKPFSKLRENVTSKKGTTFEALEVFRKEKLGKIVEKAVKAAKKRSEELGK